MHKLAACITVERDAEMQTFSYSMVAKKIFWNQT